jgi:apolipoprotein N-acyltransferase
MWNPEKLRDWRNPRANRAFGLLFGAFQSLIPWVFGLQPAGLAAMFTTMAFFLVAVLLALGMAADGLWARLRR